MAIHIKIGLYGTMLLDREKLERRLEFGIDWLKFFDFKFLKGEIWQDAPTLQLKGRLKDSFDRLVTKEIMLKIKGGIERTAIIKIKGVLLVKGKKYPASMHITNLRKYLEIYGHIEFDTSPDPIEDILFANPELWNKMIDSIRIKVGGAYIDGFYIGYSPDALFDPKERIFSHSNHMRDFFEEVFKAIKAEGQDDSRFIQNLKILNPSDIGFLAQKIESKSESFSLLKNKSDLSEIAIAEGSLTLRALKEDSFLRFYELFRDEFIDSVKKEWMDEDKLDSILDNWLVKYRANRTT